ncbi:MAG: PP2C family protein-serine/threonine phosphatase [Phycisphaerales bacterium]
MPQRLTRILRLSDAGGRPVYVAVFLIFAPVGLLIALIQPQAWGWGGGLVSASFSGAMAVLWANGLANKRWWVVAVALVLPFVGAPQFFQLMSDLGAFRLGAGSSELVRRIVLAVLAVVMTSIGFSVLAAYLRRNERRVAAARAELDIAKRMHEDIVPAIDRRIGPAHVVGVSVASSEMGGDLIDVVEKSASGGSAGHADLILADVSGHGVAAGLVMGMLKGAARARLLAPGGLDELARDLNRVLTELTPGHTFVTAAFLRVHSDRRVEWALAGHLPILWRLADGTVKRLENQSLPLGVDAGESFPVGELRASAGDVLVVLTDGLMEAADARGKQLGFDALEAIVLRAGDRPAREVVAALIEAAQRHAGGARIDDQSVMVVRVE